MTNCDHVVRLRAHGQPFEDSNIILMATAFRCERCGTWFRAIGVCEDVTCDAPGAADGGRTTVFPLVPIGEEPMATAWRN